MKTVKKEWSWDSFWWGAVSFGSILWTLGQVHRMLAPAEPVGVGGADIDSSPSAPVSAPAGPPCIRETCAERPDRLWCADLQHHPQTANCIAWKIIYAQHCDCVEWKGAE